MVQSSPKTGIQKVKEEGWIASKIVFRVHDKHLSSLALSSLFLLPTNTLPASVRQEMKQILVALIKTAKLANVQRLRKDKNNSTHSSHPLQIYKQFRKR